MKRRGGNLKALLSERSQSEVAAYGMIPTVWHSEERQNYEVKRSVGAEVQGEEGQINEAERIFRTCTYSLWYHNSGQMSLPIYQNPYNTRMNPAVNYGLCVVMTC